MSGHKRPDAPSNGEEALLQRQGVCEVGTSDEKPAPVMRAGERNSGAERGVIRAVPERSRRTFGEFQPQSTEMR
jgi:hypothetical protein